MERLRGTTEVEKELKTIEQAMDRVHENNVRGRRFALLTDRRNRGQLVESHPTSLIIIDTSISKYM